MKDMRNWRITLLFALLGFFLVQCKQDRGAETGKAVGGQLDHAATEKHRPRYHFTPPAKWMNDPNGMVYYDGEYHLFYQHYPDGVVWGPMHWGHAVSTDLVNWQHLPIALYPDSLGYIFSGSAVVDWNNTSGLGKDGKPPMVAIFTHHDPVGAQKGRQDFQVQSIAYSNDRGRTWIKYAGNPVVKNPGIRDFRDPKVIRDEVRGQWVMVFAAWDHVKFYTSPNLIDWKHASDFGRKWGTHAGVWECPDIFPMNVDGTGELKWVLLVSINPGGPNGGSGTQYFVGDFDGEKFTLDPGFAGRLGHMDEVVPEGYVFEDFEENRYENWRKEGFAFGNYPAKGAITGQGEVTGFKGERLVNSFFNGDETMGTLVSPSFEIKNRYINFLIGGGMHPGNAGMDLVINDEIVRTATGSQRDILSWQSWDVQEYVGSIAKIMIYDSVSTGWGHILVDEIMFSDQPARPATEKAVFLDYGRDNYAGVTWSDIPPEDGRRIFLGWMSNWDYANVVPTKSWRSAMTLPRVLKLGQYDGDFFVTSQPVAELQNLRDGVHEMPSTLVTPKTKKQFMLENGVAEIELELSFDEGGNGNFIVEFSNDVNESIEIGIDLEGGIWYTDRRDSGPHAFSALFALSRHQAPVIRQGREHKLHLYLDVASIEVFANDGLTVFTEIYFPTVPMQSMDFKSEGGNVRVEGVRYSLKSANFEPIPK